MKSKFGSLLNPLNLILFVWWLGKTARDRAYDVLFPGILTIPLGILASLGAAGLTANSFGFSGDNWFLPIWPALGSALFTGAFLFPWAYSIGKSLSELISIVTKGLAETLLPGLVGVLRYLPFSGSGWDHIDSQENRSFNRVVSFVGYASSFVATGIFAGSIGLAIQAWIGTSFLGWGWIAAGFATSIIFAAIATFFWDAVEHGKLPGVAVILGAPVAFLVAQHFGGSLVNQLLIGAGSFLVFVAYGFIVVHLFFSEGLKRGIKAVRPLMDSVYDLEETDFRKLGHHFFSWVATAGLVYFASWLSGLMGWPQAAVIAASVVAFLVGYFGVIHTIRHSGGNQIVAFLVSAALGIWGGFFYLDAHWLISAFVAVVAGVVNFCVVFPGIYRIVQFFLSGITDGAGNALNGLHRWATDIVKKVHKNVFEKSWDLAFHDKSEFKGLSGQVSNLLFTGLVGYIGWYLGAGSFDGLWAILGTAAAAVAVLLAYVAGGRAVKHNGAEPILVTISVVAALAILVTAFQALPWTWYFAAPAALALSVASGYFVALYILSPVYAGIRFVVLSVGGPSWKEGLTNFLGGINEFVWKRFDSIVWSRLEASYKRLAAFLAPKLAAVIRTYEALKARMEALFGGRKSR
jgi:hypothetical protein